MTRNRRNRLLVAASAYRLRPVIGPLMSALRIWNDRSWGHGGHAEWNREWRHLTDAVEKWFVTVANRDSVDFALYATELDDDGAAVGRSESVFLPVQAGRSHSA